jgi:hypothetical protein
MFLGTFLGSRCWQNRKGNILRKKNYKGRCVKRAVQKSKEICRTYDDIHDRYLDRLQEREDVKEIRCNVPVTLPQLGEYTTDVVCVLESGELFVRECVYRKLIAKPLTVKLLDASREYWLKRGVLDWGIVVDAQE